MVVGLETAPTTGQKHWQGFVHLKVKKSMQWMQANLGVAHYTIANGTDAQNKEYCSKENLQFEIGEPFGAKEAGKKGGVATAKKWASTKTYAKQGRLEEIDPQIYVCHYNTLKKIAGDNVPTEPRIDGQLTDHFLWLYGKPGCGKSQWVRRICEQIGIPYYTKGTSHFWWDDYKGEPITLLDDFSLKDAEKIGGQFKTWADHYPFQAQIKGGMRVIRPQFIIVTSNYRIDQVGFPDETTVEAVKRRFLELEWDGSNANFGDEQHEDVVYQEWAEDQRTQFQMGIGMSDYTQKFIHNMETVSAAVAAAEEMGPIPLDDEEEEGIDVENESLGSVRAEREQEAAYLLAMKHPNQAGYFGHDFETQQTIVLDDEDEEDEYST